VTRRAKYLGHRCVAVTDAAYAVLVAIAEEEQRRTGLFVSLTTVASRAVMTSYAVSSFVFCKPGVSPSTPEESLDGSACERADKEAT